MFNLLKISIGKIFVYFYVSIAVLSLIIIACVSLFLYKNFYQTITSSAEVLVLRREVAIEDIDMNKFEEIVQKIEGKTESRQAGFSINFR
ncbi:MAG: hypothetical protein PHZ04_03395 [Patescibacteria group bacterium]|nr:hypothetical protein [Patescibacteria group bacterium]MDD5554217.1 hypothetical protein [Patescibacteria group bacterium]